jgi:hypothetical protein
MFHRLSVYLLHTLDDFQTTDRQRPDNEWCGRSADGYIRSNPIKLFKQVRVKIKFILVLVLILILIASHLVADGLFAFLATGLSVLLSYVQCRDSLPFTVCAPRFFMLPGRQLMSL